jgi:hypothetical protein
MLDDDEWEPMSSRRWLRMVALVVALAMIAPIVGWLVVYLFGG